MKYQQFPHSASVDIKDRSFEVCWSKAAELQFKQRDRPLLAEMELKFACMVRMRVHFHDDLEHPKAIDIHDKLRVIYRPVAGQSCSLSESLDKRESGELLDGPMANRFPKRLGIDFVRGEWVGEYV